MSTLRNKVQLIGHVGNAPEIINLEVGKKLSPFSMATNETRENSKGEKVTDTQWHNIIAWGKLADLIENHTQRGKELGIRGKPPTRSYEDKGGVKRYISEVFAANYC